MKKIKKIKKTDVLLMQDFILKNIIAMIVILD